MGIRVITAGTAILLLAGCSSVPTGPVPTPTDWAAVHQTYLNEHGLFPPADPPYGEVDARAALVPIADKAWANVTAQFPDAARPAGGFVRWSNEDDKHSTTSDLAMCLASHGQTVDLGTDASGGKPTLGWGGDETVESWVGAYFCTEVAYPDRPKPPLNSVQLGYFYDYLTDFVAPCLEDHGVKTASAISRDDFVSEYPNQGWFPWVNAIGDMTGLSKDCPTEPTIDHSS